MGAAPPWGQSLLRSCLAAHSFPPPPPPRGRAPRDRAAAAARRDVLSAVGDPIRRMTSESAKLRGRRSPIKRGVGAGRSAERGTSAATTGPRGARSAPPNPERVYSVV